MILRHALALGFVSFATQSYAQAMSPTNLAPATISDFAVWNNTLRSLQTNGPGQATDTQSGPINTGGFTIQTLINSAGPYTAQQIYRMSTGANVLNYDGIRSVGVVNPGSTVTNVGQISAYQVGLNPNGVGATSGNGVLFFGVGVAGANGVTEFGLNPILTDNTNYTMSKGTGRTLQNELDFNVTSPDTTPVGLVATGASLAQPKGGVAFQASQLGAGIKWPNGFVSADGAAINAILIGKTESGKNKSSQPVLFTSADSAGNLTTTVLQNSPIGVFTVSPGGPSGPVPLNLRVQVSADKNLWVRQTQEAVGGVNITSQNDAQDSVKPLELTGSTVSVFGPFALKAALVTALPKCDISQAGHMYTVSDANSPSYNMTLSGNGNSYAIALCDGANWKAH